MKRRTIKKRVKVETREPRPVEASSLTREDSSIALASYLIDSLLERIHKSKVKVFDATLLEQLRKLTASELKELARHYKRTTDDLQEAVAGNSYFREAYKQFTLDQLKLALKFLKHIRTIKPDEKANGRKLRVGHHGPRKRKQRPPEKVVAKVLYLPKDKETGLTSLEPKELVGATELWVYNTKTRKLGCYYANSEDGLSAKGTTVLNYDEGTSKTKTIRKPKEQLRQAMSGQVAWLHQYWNAIRAVPQDISPRLNRFTLILRVK